MQQKHDTEENWQQATGFSPLEGEIVVYDPDETHDYSRIKIGQDKINVNNLPFIGDEKFNVYGHAKYSTYWDANTLIIPGIYSGTYADPINIPQSMSQYTIIVSETGINWGLVEGETNGGPYVPNAGQFAKTIMQTCIYGDGQIYTRYKNPDSINTTTDWETQMKSWPWTDWVKSDNDYYAICSTAGNVKEKTVQIPNFSLKSGKKVLIKFTHTHTLSHDSNLRDQDNRTEVITDIWTGGAPTLNINGLGAKSINYNGKCVPPGHPAAGKIYEMIYDGTAFNIIGDLSQDMTFESLKGQDYYDTFAIGAPTTDTNKYGATFLFTDCMNFGNTSRGVFLVEISMYGGNPDMRVTPLSAPANYTYPTFVYFTNDDGNTEFAIHRFQWAGDCHIQVLDNDRFEITHKVYSEDSISAYTLNTIYKQGMAGVPYADRSYKASALGPVGTTEDGQELFYSGDTSKPMCFVDGAPEYCDDVISSTAMKAIADEDGNNIAEAYVSKTKQIQTLEAEDWVVDGSGITVGNKGDGSGQYAGGIGNGNALQFTGIEIENAGACTVNIYYISMETRSLDIRVNGVSQVVNCPGNAVDWDTTVSQVSIRADFVAGNGNYIALDGVDGGYAPNIDYIEIISYNDFSYDDLANKPFGETLSDVEVTWDGSIEGKDSTTIASYKTYKISDNTFSSTSIVMITEFDAAANTTISLPATVSLGKYDESTGYRYGSITLGNYQIYMFSTTTGKLYPESLGTVPSPGLYVTIQRGGNFVAPTNFKIYWTDNRSLKTLDAKYLPVDGTEPYALKGIEGSSMFSMFKYTENYSISYNANLMTEPGIYACFGINVINFPSQVPGNNFAPILIVQETGIGMNYTTIAQTLGFNNAKTLVQICFNLGVNSPSISSRYKIPQSTGTYNDWSWSAWTTNSLNTATA